MGAGPTAAHAPGPEAFERVVVIGSSGSGKTTLARAIAGALGSEHIELDALYWGPDWSEPDDASFLAAVSEAAQAPRWACDGNYGQVRELLWRRATAIVWLDLPFPIVLWRVLRRTLRRSWTREELWAGNTESLARSFLSPDSILWYVLTTFRDRRRRYDALSRDPSWEHLHWRRLHRPHEVERLLHELTRAGPAR